MARRKNTTTPGTRFYDLTAVRLHEINEKGEEVWLCKCDCGNETLVRIGNLLKERPVKSCGCRRRKHGLYHTRIRQTHADMKQRCYNPKIACYKNYGGRGIKVCDEWLGEDGFINFYRWAMANGYNDSLTLDRINNDGDYSPDNCKWATMKEQQNNRRNNHIVEYNGERLNIKQWSEKTGIQAQTIQNRLERGFPLSDVFYKGNLNILARKKERKKVKNIDNGEIFDSALEASEKYGVAKSAIYRACRTGRMSCGCHWEYID